MITQQYVDYYSQQADIALSIWRDKTRIIYEADVWANEDRNRICLDLLGDVSQKDVLVVGAGGWFGEQEFLQAIEAKSLLRTDLLPLKGIGVACNACALPFKDETFEAVICRELIEHVPDEGALLIEMRRVLKPRGWLLITTPNGFDLHPDGKEHVRSFTPRGFLMVLRETGFTPVEKRGNVPNIYYTLLKSDIYRADAGMAHELLEEFKEIAEKIADFEDSYYIGTQLFVLARKA